jgi:hypothetical protein
MDARHGLPMAQGPATGDGGDLAGSETIPCAWCLIALDLLVPPPDLSLPALLPPEAQTPALIWQPTLDAGRLRRRAGLLNF